MPSSRPPRGSFPRKPPYPKQPKKRMMSQGRKEHFLYDAREFLSRTGMDPTQISSFVETLFQRGSRGSTEEAKSFIEEKVRENLLSPEEGRHLAGIVEEYSFWR